MTMFCTLRRSKAIQLYAGLASARRFTASAPKTRMQMNKERERDKLLRVGVPLILFMFGGTYFLSIFMDTKLEIKDRKMGQSKSVRNFDLEEEHKALMEKLKLEDFSLSRIPRPDEGKTEVKPHDTVDYGVKKRLVNDKEQK